MYKPVVLAAAALAAAVSLVAVSAAWPQSARVVKILVPFAPGGGVDVVARVVAQQVGDLQGPTMVVENRPGGGTVLAAEDVLRATADGSTLLFINNSVVVAPQLRKLDYDPLSDLTAVCKIASTPTVIVVAADSPYRTLSDLIGAARAKPGDGLSEPFPARCCRSVSKCSSTRRLSA